MRRHMSLVEHILPQPEPIERKPESVHEFGGFKFIHLLRSDGSLGWIEIKHGDENKQIGMFLFSTQNGTTVSGHLDVSPGFRGQGMGINLYKIIIKILEGRGVTLVPSKIVSDRAHAIWLKLDPSSMDGYQRADHPWDDNMGHLWCKDLSKIRDRRARPKPVSSSETQPIAEDID